MKAELTIARDNYGTINVYVKDIESRITFLSMKMSPEALALAITGLSEQEVDFEVRGLEYIGKTWIKEPRSIKYSGKDTYNREELSKWLVKNAQEEGWILDPYLGSQRSIVNLGDGTKVLNYSVFKYVEKEKEEV